MAQKNKNEHNVQTTQQQLSEERSESIRDKVEISPIETSLFANLGDFSSSVPVSATINLLDIVTDKFHVTDQELKFDLTKLYGVVIQIEPKMFAKIISLSPEWGESWCLALFVITRDTKFLGILNHIKGEQAPVETDFDYAIKLKDLFHTTSRERILKDDSDNRKNRNKAKQRTAYPDLFLSKTNLASIKKVLNYLYKSGVDATRIYDDYGHQPELRAELLKPVYPNGAPDVLFTKPKRAKKTEQTDESAYIIDNPNMTYTLESLFGDRNV